MRLIKCLNYLLPDLVKLLREKYKIQGYLIGNNKHKPNQNDVKDLPLVVSDAQFEAIRDQLPDIDNSKSNYDFSYFIQKTLNDYIKLINLRCIKKNDCNDQLLDCIGKLSVQEVQCAIPLLQIQDISDLIHQLQNSQDFYSTLNKFIMDWLKESNIEQLSNLPKIQINYPYDHSCKYITLTENNISDEIATPQFQTGQVYADSGLKYGSDFTVYQQDPLLCHSSSLVRNIDEDEQIKIKDLFRWSRIADDVNKNVILAKESDDDSVHFTISAVTRKTLLLNTIQDNINDDDALQ